VAYGFDWNTGFATRDDPTANSLPPITLRPPRELTFELAGTLPADARRTMLDLREFSPITYRWYRSAWASPVNPNLRVEPDLNDGDRHGFVDGVITVHAQSGSYVRARAKSLRDGLASPWVEIGPDAKGSIRKTLKLQKLATVSGVISDKTGQPVPSLKVRANGAPNDTVTAESDSNGSFTLRDISLEATEITVGENTTSPVRVNLPLDKSKPLHIHLDHDRRSLKPKPPAF
jgi:hypothetical protein